MSMVGELTKELRTSTNVQYANFAGLMIAHFDWLLVFESEIELIWKSKGVRMKVLYMLTRYLPMGYLSLFLAYRFPNNFTKSDCTAMYIAMGAMFSTGALAAALIVTIRTWAVWAREKYMTYILFGTYIVAAALIVIFFIISLKYTTHPTVSKGSPLGCIPKYESSYLPAAFVVEAIYDTVTLALMLIRGVSLYQWGRNSRVFQTLYRDGIMFYVYITAVSIANAVLLFSQSLHGGYDVVLLPFQAAIRSVLACRIILHIRMELQKPDVLELPDIKGAHTVVYVESGGTELQDV